MNMECANAVEEVILGEGSDTVGAIILEPITAGGGVLPPVKEYYPTVQEICKKYGVWIIMDEVVCGFGKTGKFWGHNHYDIDPDMVTMAKGLASSYEALSATVVQQEIYDIFLNDPASADERMNYFRDINTYVGCTVPMTAALESTRIIEVGAYLLERLMTLKKLPNVGDVRGVGLFCGVEFVLDKVSHTPISETQMGLLMCSNSRSHLKLSNSSIC